MNEKYIEERFRDMYRVGILTAAICLILATTTFGEIPEIEGSADIYFTDNYFWRAAGDGNPHLQYDFGLSTSIAGLGISFSPWVSHNLDNMDVDEVDYAFDLSYSILEALSVNAGVLYYDVTGIEETGEFYGALGYEIPISEMLSMSPGITFYYDFMEVDKPYLEASVSAGVSVFEPLSASLSAVIGFDFGQYESDDFENGPTVLQIGVSADYQLTEVVTLTPAFTYVLGLADVFDNDTFLGVNIGFGF
ncbi:hypothetical protein GF312_05315 [Candidatus Poribacteria bacterium]|nr:hypothetical protein [Candidatus Poribacteria bacterium]